MKTALVTFLICICFGVVSAQEQTKPNAADIVQDLQLQLIELGAREETAKLQVQALDEALKPENIERSLAGVGSTRPEELREQRRRQLTIEKTAVVAQLEQLTLQRSRLESELATAQVQAYQQSASGIGPIEQYFGTELTKSGWLVVLLVAGVGAIAAFVIGLLVLKNYMNKRGLRIRAE
jgi:ribosomal protein S7